MNGLPLRNPGQCLICGLLASSMFVTAPVIAQEWSRTIPSVREANRIVVQSDGDLVVAGWPGFAPSTLNALSPSGEPLWTTNVVDSSGVGLKATDMVVADEDAVVVATEEGTVIAFSADGIPSWSRKIEVEIAGMLVPVHLVGIERTHDGGFVVAGYDRVAYSYAGFIIRLTSDGSVLWIEAVESEGFLGMMLGDVAVLDDGRIVAEGTSSSLVQGEPGGTANPFLAVIGADGGSEMTVSLLDTLIADHLDWIYRPRVRIAPKGESSLLVIGFNATASVDEWAPSYLGRFDATGQRDWSMLLQFERGSDEPIRVNTSARAVATAPSGHILIAGDVTIDDGNVSTSGFVVRFSPDGGLQEEQLISLPGETLRIEDLALGEDRVFVAGSRDSTWYVAEISFPTGVSHETPTPNTYFRIESNYPEPFRDETTIVVHTAGPELLEIEVFDLLGRRVHRQREAASGAGRYAIVLQLDLPSGIYLSRITDGIHAAEELLVVVR